MTITINRHTTEELKTRRKEIYKTFEDSGYRREGGPMTKKDLRDLVVMGVLSTDERRLYDELSRIESLLNR